MEYNFDDINTVAGLFDTCKELNRKYDALNNMTKETYKKMLLADLKLYVEALGKVVKRIENNYGRQILDLVNNGLTNCHMNHIDSIGLNNNEDMVSVYVTYIKGLDDQEFGQVVEQTGLTVGLQCELDDLLHNRCKIDTNKNGISPYAIISLKDAGKIVLDEV